jgi:hypothetical protein
MITGFISSWDKYDLVWIAGIVFAWIIASKLKSAGNGELRDFLHENGVKLIVLSAFVFLVLLAHHSVANAPEMKFADWCMAKAGEALACFFGLIQGSKLLTGNGNGSPQPPIAGHEEKKL